MSEPITKCPRCGSKDMYLTEQVSGWSFSHWVEGGTLNGHHNTEPPDPTGRVRSTCDDCGHCWELRGASLVRFREQILEVDTL